MRNSFPNNFKMAFVNRAERKLQLYTNASDVGPGTYIGHSAYKKTQITHLLPPQPNGMQINKISYSL